MVLNELSKNNVNSTTSTSTSTPTSTSTSTPTSRHTSRPTSTSTSTPTPTNHPNVSLYVNKNNSTSTSTSTSNPSSSSTTTPQPSTTTNSSSTPSVYDTNDNNIYNFPLLHGGNSSSSSSSRHFSETLKNFKLTPAVLIIFLVVVIVFVLLFTSLTSLGKTNSSDSSDYSNSSDSSDSNSGSKSHIITIIIIVVIVIAISFLYRKFEDTTIIASIKKLFTKNPQVNVIASKTPPLPLPSSQSSDKNKDKDDEVREIKLYKEVFNIPGNNYTYSQAQSICTAYDAKLATYDELEDAYIKGAEWCNYGWSEGQMALFPTQKKTYNTLQTIKGHEHDCGRPGINGGYMANPNVRYGVNCYGHKPKRTKVEKELMENTAPYPLTKEDMLMEKQVDYWKQQLPNIIVSPFNNNRWTKF